MSSTTLSEAYRDHPLSLHHVIPLDFNTIPTVPDSHLWPPSDDDFPSDDRLSIPVVDLMDPDAVKLIGDACETWGVFHLTGHGIPLSLLEHVEVEGRQLFSLPAEQKLKALRSPGGATGYGVAQISPFFPKYMWHEGFTIMGSPLEQAIQLWPDDHKRFCDVMDDYQKQMKMLAEKVISLIMRSLEIHEEMIRIWPEPAGTALQLNSYPSCPDPNRVMGLAPHTDSLLLTILHQSATTTGLQIFKEEVGWVLVYPIHGALVVNVGDLLHILSNARFPSVLHRAIVSQSKHRLSVAYFYGPPPDFNVTPLVKCLNSDQMTGFLSVTVKEYISIKAKNLEKALSLIRI
ncbi:2OG-FeII_Oxy domain-containing protein/DIOX_N domain-containing protein [Cephalotus follicularis]|uniref:gibberellin 3beta-dioxygenase n=1 Tax=Cephalotus follicularis TaxID=3775 RepID=A0A1Q3C3N6_CEPFO|nr:2OG-FeII_Oxy domain-containing protein/DIOX_N domain-containing protein [Cephalotus follicularis]